MYSVYALSDPRTNEVRYVGLSGNVTQRYAQHMARPYEKRAWIQELEQIGKKPTLTIIEDNLSLEEASKREQYWIGYYLQSGASLFNFTRRDGEMISGTPFAEDKSIFTPAEAAEYLSQKVGRRITVARLLQLRKENRVTAARATRSTTLYNRSDLDNADITIRP